MAFIILFLFAVCEGFAVCGGQSWRRGAKCDCKTDWL